MKQFVYTVKAFSSKIISDKITSYAAQSCFYITLSSLPFLLVIINLTNYLPVTHLDIIRIIESIAPPQLKTIFTDVILDIHSNSSLTFTSLTALTALWSSGRGFMAIINGLNTIYDVEHPIGWLKLRLKSTIYTIVFIILISITLTLLVFGTGLTGILAQLSPPLAKILTELLGRKILFFPIIFTIFFTIIYTYIPNRKSSIKRELPGAVLTALGWYIFSNLYSFYVTHSPSFSYMYRGLTALIFALIWIYVSVIIMLFGAEVNHWLFTHNHSRNDVPG